MKMKVKLVAVIVSSILLLSQAASAQTYGGPVLDAQGNYIGHATAGGSVIVIRRAKLTPI
jgi:hypothetical protein